MLHVSSYCCICRIAWVLVLLHMSAYCNTCVSSARACSLATPASRTYAFKETSATRVSSSCDTCVLMLLHMSGVRRLLSGDARIKNICIQRTLLHLCLHPATLVTSCCYICALVLLHTATHVGSAPALWLRELRLHTALWRRSQAATYCDICG